MSDRHSEGKCDQIVCSDTVLEFGYLSIEKRGQAKVRDRAEKSGIEKPVRAEKRALKPGGSEHRVHQIVPKGLICKPVVA